MERTLGKRIMEHRKRLGLTQDALAEKLGITAQAISKWENDLSCPDIATLPRLAAIFGITTDELLGMEPQSKVHQAEVVGDDDDSDQGIFNFSLNSKESENGKWEFRWDSGRRSAVGFACWVLLMGILLLCNNLLTWDVGFWSLAWPSSLLMLGLFSGKLFSLSSLVLVVLGGYFLVDNLGLMPMELSGKVIWPAMVILFGLSLLFDALRKPKKPKFSVVRHGKDSEKSSWHSVNNETSFECALAFGQRTYRAEVAMLEEGEATVNFGELTVDLSGCNAVAEGCNLEVTCGFGELTLLVPKCYAVQCENATMFASIDITGQPDSVPTGIIGLEATANFGQINIRYI